MLFSEQVAFQELFWKCGEPLYISQRDISLYVCSGSYYWGYSCTLWLLEILDLIFVHYAGRVRNIFLLDCLTNIRYRQPSSSADSSSQVILKLFQALCFTPVPYRWFMICIMGIIPWLSGLLHVFISCAHLFLFLLFSLAQLFLWSYHISILHFCSRFNNVFVKFSSFCLWNPLTCCELNCVLFAECSRKLALIPRC